MGSTRILLIVALQRAYVHQSEAAVLFDGGRFAAQNAFAVKYGDFGEAEIIHTGTGERHLVHAKRRKEGAARASGQSGWPLCGFMPVYDGRAGRWLMEVAQRVYDADGACAATVYTRLYWNGRNMQACDMRAAACPLP